MYLAEIIMPTLLRDDRTSKVRLPSSIGVVKEYPTVSTRKQNEAAYLGEKAPGGKDSHDKTHLHH